MKLFQEWKTQEVEEAFELQEVDNHSLLKKWLEAENEVSTKEQVELEELRSNTEYNAHFWNEMELRWKLLAPLLELINYDTNDCRTFWERSFTIEKNDEVIANGNIDFLIGRGRQLPRSPFNFVLESNPTLEVKEDPLGKLLMSLLSVYQLNQKQEYNFPLYGAYVVGQFFYFVVFDGKTYAKSKPYVASEKDIFDIFRILKEVKIYIEALIAAEKK